MYRAKADVQYLQPQRYGLCFFRLLNMFVINKSGLSFFFCLFFFLLILHTRLWKILGFMYLTECHFIPD
ncbi:hypothetical protein LEADMM271B_17785 [Leclercia adecarboxylata]